MRFKLFNNTIRAVAFTILTVSAISLFAQDIKFTAIVNSNQVSLGSRVSLQLKFEGTQNVPAPALPDFDGFQTRYLGPSTMVSIVNGNMTSAVTHTYHLLPTKTGTFTIGPFSIKIGKDTYTSEPITIEVVDSPVLPNNSNSSSPSSFSSTKSINLEDKIFITMSLVKEPIYINELVPLAIRLYSAVDLNVRDEKYPDFNHEGFSVSQFQEPRRYQEVVSGVTYNVLELTTKVFALKSGDLSLGPAELDCNLIMPQQNRRRSDSFFDDFFGSDSFSGFFGAAQMHPIRLRSAPVSVKVSPLPEENKPENFKGAVGNFKMQVDVSPNEVNVGDPITLKTTVSGEGNFNTVTAPSFKNTDDFKVYDPQASVKDNEKVFEQVIIPKSETVTQIPATKFSFFNPQIKEYVTLENNLIPITVKKNVLDQGLKIVEPQSSGAKPFVDESLGKDIVYIKESPGEFLRQSKFVYQQLWFLIINLLSLLIMLTIILLRRRQDRLRTDIKYARRVHAPKKIRRAVQQMRELLKENNNEQFYETVFKSIQKYFADKYHLSAAGITSPVIDEVLRPQGVKEDILKIIGEIFADCDMARYAASEFNAGKMQKTFDDLQKVISYFERNNL